MTTNVDARNMVKKILIIGAGPAGYTAAIYAARAGLNPLIIRGLQPGGQLSTTTDVENYPGFSETIQGPWLMEQMENQAKNVGARIDDDIVIRVSIDRHQSLFSVVCDSKKEYITKTIVLATGAQAKWLGIPSEEKYRGFGVSACATCDGFFFKNKEVVVIGGGNTAAEEALFLTNFVQKVTLVHRRAQLRCEKILEKRLLSHKKITVLWNKAVNEIIGTPTSKMPNMIKGVTKISLRDTQTQAISVHATDGVFVAIGHAPVTDFIKDKIACDSFGYAQVGNKNFPHMFTMTSVPGIFAAGDVTDSIYRQAVTAAGMGCMAALDAERYISQISKSNVC